MITSLALTYCNIFVPAIEIRYIVGYYYDVFQELTIKYHIQTTFHLNYDSYALRIRSELQIVSKLLLKKYLSTGKWSCFLV